MGATSTFAFYLVPILFAVTCSSSALKKDDCSVALAAAGQGSAVDWAACRAAAINMTFGTPSLPTKASPDYAFPLHPTSPGGQTRGVGPNTTALVWTVSEGGLTLNATVYWSLNTSGSAYADYPFGENPPLPPHPVGNDPQSAGQSPGNGDTDTLVMYHNGHETHWVGPKATEPLCVRPPYGQVPQTPEAMATCFFNYDTTAGWINELGYDTMEFNMPLRGPNNNGSFGTMSHKIFLPYEEKGVHTLRYFIEPVVMAVNFAKAQGYSKIVMVGLSGGGWTTTVAAGLDSRIDLSIPIAGSLPFAMRYEHKGDPYHDVGDYEQLEQRPLYSICDYKCLYALGGLEEHRIQLQMLHEEDACCFRAGGGRPNGHGEILAYNTEVQNSGIKGFMCTAATSGNVHEVNLRDKTIVASMVDQLDQGALNLKELGCKHLPFNVLERW